MMTLTENYTIAPVKNVAVGAVHTVARHVTIEHVGYVLDNALVWHWLFNRTVHRFAEFSIFEFEHFANAVLLIIALCHIGKYLWKAIKDGRR